MTNKVYRTSRGKQIDMGALQLKNELVKSIGNMGVNARGDVVDSFDNPIDTATAQARRHYNRQTSKIQNTPVTQKRPAK